MSTHNHEQETRNHHHLISTSFSVYHFIDEIGGPCGRVLCGSSVPLYPGFHPWENPRLPVVVFVVQGQGLGAPRLTAQLTAVLRMFDGIYTSRS
jgi:hypothetical protein